MSYSVRYVKSDSMPVQGKAQEIYRRYGREWNISEYGNGNGNWLLTKKSDIIVNGKSYRDFVLDHYGKSKLTHKLAEKFENDLNNGKINLT